MRGKLAAGGFAVAVLALTACGSAPAVGGSPAAASAGTTVSSCTDFATYAAEVSDAGKVIWQKPLPQDASSGTSPAVINGVAVFAEYGHLVGLRAASGRRLWDVHAGPPDPSRPYFEGVWQWGGNAITVIRHRATDSRLTVINPATGKVRWQLKFPAAVRVQAAPSDGLIVLTGGRYLYVVNLAKGHLAWSRKFFKPDPHGNFGLGVAVTDGVVVAGTFQMVPLAPGILAGFSAKTGARLWTRTGYENHSVQADGKIVLLAGDAPGPPRSQPLTVLSAVNGKRIWHVPVEDIYRSWTAPGQVIYSSSGGIYDLNLATGAQRWKVANRPDNPQVTGTDILYFNDSRYYPRKPPLTARRLGDGAVAWKQPAVTDSGGFGETVITTLNGPNALVADGNSADQVPRTSVYAVNLRTGKLAAVAKLRSDLLENPAVIGSDAVYQLEPDPCIMAGG